VALNTIDRDRRGGSSATCRSGFLHFGGRTRIGLATVVQALQQFEGGWRQGQHGVSSTD